MKVDLIGENIGQLTDHRVGQTGFVSGGVQRTGHSAACHADAGAEFGRFLRGFQALWGALDDQTLEGRIGFVAQPTHTQLTQLLSCIDLGRYRAARTHQGLFGQRVFAQKSSRWGIDHAHTAQQAFRCIRRTSQIRAYQVQVFLLNRQSLLSQVGDVHRRAHAHHGLVRNVWTQIGDSKGTATASQQHRSHGGADGFGVAKDPSTNGMQAEGQLGMLAIEPDQCALNGQQGCAQSGGASDQQLDEQGAQPCFQIIQRRHSLQRCVDLQRLGAANQKMGASAST